MTRLGRLALVALASLCAVTIGGGVTMARLLPGRLALLQLPRVAPGPAVRPGGMLPAADGSPAAVAVQRISRSGLSGLLSAILGAGGLGADPGAMVADLSTGAVLFARNASTGFTPASTTKLATSVAALDLLGPAATFTTRVTGTPGSAAITLTGGGDPTLAAGQPPPADYPQPATLKDLAAQTARVLRARHQASVRLSYVSALFTGPELAPGWPAFGTADNYVLTGNVAPVAALEVDQGRLTARGTPEDADDPSNYRPRSLHPALQAAAAFARFLRADGIAVAMRDAPAGPAASQGPLIASVSSPPLAQIVQWMLTESNNEIAETLARHVAIATGRPPTFAGGAAAVMATDRGLGVTGLHLVDGSGLSPLDRISPQALVKLLDLAAGGGPGPPGLRPVITGLPVAGFSGTLAPGSIFGGFGAAALGTVRAKTGNLSTVAALAGIAYARDGQLLAFAFMGDRLSRRYGLAGAGASLAQLATVLAGCGCR